MDINKAIKRQKKSYKILLLAMCLIFLFLPIILFICGRTNMFFISYLIIIEMLILISIYNSINDEFLKFQYDKYKLKVEYGVLRRRINIICDKVVMVHTEDIGKDFQIVLITKSRFRNKRIKKVDYKFLKINAYMSHYYSKIKKQNLEEEYYYIIIKNGGYYKYELLDIIYKTCVQAYFTDEVIEKIKLYRK